MKQKDKDNRLYTRGGQIVTNNLRMLLQVNKTVLHVLLLVSIMLIAFYVWLVCSWDTLQAAYYSACAFILSKIWMSDHVFHILWHGKDLHIDVNGVLEEGYFIKERAEFFNHLKTSTVFGVTTSIVGMFLARWYLIRKGREQSERKFIRGSQLVSTSIYKRAVNRCESGPSDIAISGVPMINGFEVKHTLIHGTTGSGKGQTLNQFLERIRARGDSAIIFDKGCVFTELFHNPKTDVVLNPFDVRCANWDLWSEAVSSPDFENIAESLIPMHGESDPYWVSAARTVFSSAAYRMKDDPDRSIEKLLSLILTAELSDLSYYLSGTQAATLVSDKIEKTAISIRSVISTYLKSLRFLKGLEDDEKTRFCIRDWVKSVSDREESHFLFISSSAKHHASLRPLISMWLAMANITLLSLNENFDRRIWFICDELPSLHKLPHLAESIAEVRKFGGCFVLGMQSYSQLKGTYGQSGASTIFDLLNTRFFFRSPSHEMAKMVSDQIGQEEVEQTSESYSYGSNTIRDGISISTQTTDRHLVKPDEVMGLPDLQAYLRVPEKVPVTKVKIRYKFRKKASESFIPREIPDLGEPIKPYQNTKKEDQKDAPEGADKPESKHEDSGEEESKVNPPKESEVSQDELIEIVDKETTPQEEGSGEDVVSDEGQPSQTQDTTSNKGGDSDEGVASNNCKQEGIESSGEDRGQYGNFDQKCDDNVDSSDTGKKKAIDPALNHENEGGMILSEKGKEPVEIITD